MGVFREQYAEIDNSQKFIFLHVRNLGFHLELIPVAMCYSVGLFHQRESITENAHLLARTYLDVSIYRNISLQNTTSTIPFSKRISSKNKIAIVQFTTITC